MTTEIKKLEKLQELIGLGRFDTSQDLNVMQGRTVLKILDPETGQAVGQLESRKGSTYKDEPDGYAAYFEGYNWTDYCPTIEACAAQHEERKFA